MPVVYIKLWDSHDQEIMWPYQYGKNGKKRKRPIPLKPTVWQKIRDGYVELFKIMIGR